MVWWWCGLVFFWCASVAYAGLLLRLQPTIQAEPSQYDPAAIGSILLRSGCKRHTNGFAAEKVPFAFDLFYFYMTLMFYVVAICNLVIVG